MIQTSKEVSNISILDIASDGELFNFKPPNKYQFRYRRDLIECPDSAANSANKRFFFYDKETTFHLINEEPIPGDIAGLAPRRGAWEATWWLLTHAELSLIDRSRVFSVAITLKLVQMIETFRLEKGASPERC